MNNKSNRKFIKIVFLASSVLFFITTSIFTLSYLTKNTKDIQTGFAVLLGDCNNDSKVDILDFQLLSNSFGKSQGQSGYEARCDFNNSYNIDILDFQILSNNFGKSELNPIPETSPTSGLTPTDPPVNFLTRKVLVLNFNPYISGLIELSDYEYWNDPLLLQNQYISDIRNASHGFVNYEIVQTQTIHDYPVKISGFKFSNSTYLGCLNDHSPAYCGEIIDYYKLLTDYDLCTKVNSGEIHEVWLWGGPWFGYYESRMAGPNAIFVNSSPLTQTDCAKDLFIMGFSYERGIAEMTEDMGHRAESIMKHVYGDWQINQDNAWNAYTIYDKELPGKAACGNIHFPPNATSEYDFANKSFVPSTCGDWLNYPDLTGTVTQINCDAWGCYNFPKYWLTHLPHHQGVTNNKLNNWWIYIVDFSSTLNYQ